MAAIPVGMGNYTPSTLEKKVFPVYANGSGEDTAQANFCTTRSYNPISASYNGVEYQLVGIYDDPSEYVVILIRDDGGSGMIPEDEPFTSYIMDGSGGRPTMQRNAVDNHNTIGIGVSPDGIGHIAWGMHNDPMLYRKFDTTLDLWTGGMASAGTMNAVLVSVTYPHFSNAPDGTLYFNCRGTGGSGNGNSHIYKYDHGVPKSWSGLLGTTNGLFIDGEGSTGDESAYPDKLAFTSNYDGAGVGFIIISFVWDDGSQRHDKAMVKTDGVGNWYTWAGAAQTIPITTANDNVIDPVLGSAELRGEEVLLLNSLDYPILIYKHYISAGTLKDALWVNAWNGSAFVKTRIDWGLDNDYDWAAEDAVIDDNDQIHLLVTNKGQGEGIYIFTSQGSDYSKTWSLSEFTDQSVVIGTDIAQTRALIQFDPYQWKHHGRLQFLVPLAGDVSGTNTYFPSGWDYATKATGINPSSSYNDGFFIVDLALARVGARFWANVNSDLSDVRFSDGQGNMLPCYVHVYDYSGKTGMAFGRWVGPWESSGTHEVWIHYGNSSATTPAVDHILGRNNAWRNELLAFCIDGDGTDYSRVGQNLTGNGSPTEDQAGPFGTLKSTEFNGSSQYYTLTPATVSSAAPVVPCGFVVWFDADDATLTQTLCGLTDSADTDRFLVGQLRGATGGDPVTAAVAANGLATVFADSASGYSTGNWQMAAFRFTSTTSRQANLNGVSGTAETTSRAPDSLDCLTLGALRRTTVAGYFDGNLALFQFYMIGYFPSDAELAHQYAMRNQATFWGTWQDVTDGIVPSVFQNSNSLL